MSAGTRWVAMAVLAVVMLSTAQLHAANSYSGSLSNGFYRFNRPATVTTLSGEAVYFHAIYFTVLGSAPGNVTATVSANGFTPRVHFYQNGTFNPYTPLNNLYWLGGSGSTTATNLAHGVEIPHLLIVSGTSPNDVGTFTVTLSGPGVISVATNNDSALTIRTHPQDASILSGQSAVMRVWASGRQPQKFQWYYGPKPAGTNPPIAAKAIAGATNQTYATPALTQTTNYWVLVTGNNTTPTNSRSSLADVFVSIAPANFNGSLTTQHDTWNRMTTNNVSSGQICYFEVVPFRIYSVGTYTFALNTVGFPGSMNIYGPKFFPGTPVVNFVDNGVYDNAAGPLTYSILLQPGDYELVVGSASGGQVGTYSGQITGPSVVELLPKPTIPVFLNLPRGRTIMTNTTATLSFSVEGAIPRTNQWFKGVPPDASQPIAGANNKSYTTPILSSVGTNYYWVRVANAYGASTSGPVRVKVVDGPIKFSGKLRPGNKVFRRSNGAGGMVTNLSYYKTYVFEAPVAGAYNISLTGTNIGLQMSVYDQIFMTNNPNVNLYLLPNSLNFTLNVAAPSTYWLVISSPSIGSFGSYSGTITGPGLVNELPAPVFYPQPIPTNQFLWPTQDPAPIIGNAEPVDSAWSWYRGVAPGVPVDGFTNMVGLNTRTNDQPASVTAKPTNLWFWARIDGSYGYDDSELCMLEVSPPPRFMTYPTNRSIVYGNITNFTTLVTNVPFLIRWYQAPATNQSNTVQSDVIQGYGPSYVRNVTRTNTTPLYNVGSYSYWIQATNPAGVTNGPTFTLTVTPRPLTVLISVPPGVIYDGLPHPLTATVTDPVPGGPALPAPFPLVITYKLGANPATTNAPVDAGTYQVVATVNHSNYMGSVTNTFTIGKRSLTARADNAARPFGAANPVFTISYSGFANGESATVIDSQPVASTIATMSSPVGQYPIAPSGGSDNNYAFVFVTGTLTILGEPVVIAWTSAFSSNAPVNGTVAGSAVITNNVLRLTTNGNQSGAFVLPQLNWPLRKLHVEFDLLIGGGVIGDGFSFNYALDATNTTTAAEEGFGSGLSIVVDTFNDGGEAVPGIGIKYQGVMLAERVVPGVRDNTFNRFVADVDGNGLLTLKFEGATVTNIALPGWQPLPEWRISLGARTKASATDNHWIDNVVIGERASGVLLPNTASAITLALPAAFADITNALYSLDGNSDPAFVSVNVSSNGTAVANTVGASMGSADVTFRGTNASMNAVVPFNITTLQPQIMSIGATGGGTAEIRLSGPAKARFYLQESSGFAGTSDWQTVAVGQIDETGIAVAQGLPFALGNQRCYRVVLTR